MNLRRHFLLFSVLTLLASLIMASCAKQSEPAPKASGGGEAETGEGVEPRFAVFSPAIGVMLQELGYEDQIVGRHAYDTALSRSIPVVGSHIEIDYEMLIGADPTHLLFERTSVQIPARVRELAVDEGWAIWSYTLQTLDDVATTVDDLHLKLDGLPAMVQGTDIDPERRLNIELPSARLARAWSPLSPDVTSAAGRTLILAGIDPPGAMGPGSFHAQLIERMGLAPALTEGGMWQELDHEDLITLAPDSIIVIIPRAMDNQGIGEPAPLSWAQIRDRVGAIADLPIPAASERRIAVIDDPLGLLPSTSLARV